MSYITDPLCNWCLVAILLHSLLTHPGQALFASRDIDDFVMHVITGVFRWRIPIKVWGSFPLSILIWRCHVTSTCLWIPNFHNKDKIILSSYLYNWNTIHYKTVFTLRQGTVYLIREKITLKVFPWDFIIMLVKSSWATLILMQSLHVSNDLIWQKHFCQDNYKVSCKMNKNTIKVGCNNWS